MPSMARLQQGLQVMDMERHARVWVVALACLWCDRPGDQASQWCLAGETGLGPCLLDAGPVMLLANAFQSSFTAWISSAAMAWPSP